MFKFIWSGSVVLFHLSLVHDGEVLKFFRLFSLFVEFDYVFDFVEWDGKNGRRVVFVGVPYQFFEDIYLVVDAFSLWVLRTTLEDGNSWSSRW